ncbi:MAG TPA: tetratricopeptide repeat protein [Vicinamibacteria bacterium]
MKGELVRFPAQYECLSAAQGRVAAERALAVPAADRAASSKDLRLEHPEVLLALCQNLTHRIETVPATVSEEAEFFYRFLSNPVRKIGEFDERDYFLGEFALLAGGANRIQFHRDEARRWFDRAESHFVRVANPSVHFARLAYQRLGLATEERHFDEVLELAPVWSQTARQLGLVEESLKCRFLEGLASWESGSADEAIRIYRGIFEEARTLGISRLAAQAASNLAHFHSSRGEVEAALEFSRKALPLLQQMENRVHLAKLQWSIGDLHRSQGRTSEAAQAYRSALRESEEVGLRGDVAAIHLVLADLLLAAGQEAQAEWEIRAALPIIDEEQMVPEGVAALSLLRESLRRRKIDRQALRSLHGYFRE